MLQVVQPAPSYDLTTLEAVKRVTDNVHNIDHDLTLSVLIARASATIARVTHRVFAKERVVEDLDAGGGSLQLVLTRTPILALHNVTGPFDDVTSDVVIANQNAGIITYLSGFTGTRVRGNLGSIWPTEGNFQWQVDYTAGYWLPSFPGQMPAGDIPLPADVEHICIDTVNTWFRQRNRDPSLVSEKIGDWSGSYQGKVDPNSGLPEIIKNNLRFYVRELL